MFNTTRITESPRYPQTITEKRAPTDESVRLLREMETAAEKRVIERGAVQDNLFNIRWTVVHRGYDDLKECHCRYSINSREHTFKFNLGPRCVTSSDEFRKNIVDEILRIIKEQLSWKLLEQHKSAIISIPIK